MNKTVIGFVSCPEIFDGKPLPCYESDDTLDSWNHQRFTLCEHTLKGQLHRQPTEVETLAEMDRNAAEARRLLTESRCRT